MQGLKVDNMALVTILTYWSFATAEWRTVEFYQDDRGYGQAKDYATAQPVSVGFREVQGEMLCYIPISRSQENGLHVKE